MTAHCNLFSNQCDRDNDDGGDHPEEETESAQKHKEDEDVVVFKARDGLQRLDSGTFKHITLTRLKTNEK